MRAIDCPCGHHLEGADDEELFRLAREHPMQDSRGKPAVLNRLMFFVRQLAQQRCGLAR